MLLQQQSTQPREERRGAAQGGNGERPHVFKVRVENAHKIQVPIIHGWDCSLLWRAGKQFKTPEFCQMMEYHNYTLFIGHLIPAMTDAAPKTLSASTCTFMWRNKQRSRKSPAFQRWADKYLLPDGGVTFNHAYCLVTCSCRIWLLEHAYLLCDKRAFKRGPLCWRYVVV